MSPRALGGGGTISSRFGQLRTVFRGQFHPHRHKIITQILQTMGSQLGKRLLLHRRAQSLQVTPVSGPGQRAHLCARIVDVEFLGDGKASLGQQIGQRVAHNGATAMADMHRAGGVGRDILDIDAHARPNGGGAIGLARPQHRRQYAAQHRRLEGDVDKTRPGGSGSGNARHGSKGLCQFLRDIGGLAFCHTRQQQGGVSSHVAMGRVARGGQFDAGQRVFGHVGQQFPHGSQNMMTVTLEHTVRHAHSILSLKKRSEPGEYPEPQRQKRRYQPGTDKSVNRLYSCMA
jgi:hypothetical protein